MLTILNFYQEINIDEDWKVVTVWIGGNNLCDVCADEVGLPSYRILCL